VYTEKHPLLPALSPWIRGYEYIYEYYAYGYNVFFMDMNTDTPPISMNIHGYPTAAYKSYCGGKKRFKRRGETKSGNSGELYNMQHTAYYPNLGNLYFSQILC
jgi:hypothetical protein